MGTTGTTGTAESEAAKARLRARIRAQAGALFQKSQSNQQREQARRNKKINSSSRDSYANPPSLLPSISTGGSTIATAEVFLDEDFDSISNNRRRRSDRSGGVDKSKMQQLLHAPDNDRGEVDIEDIRGRRRPGNNRRLSSTSGISGITEEVPLNDLSEEEDEEIEEQNPVVRRKKRDQQAAQEQAVAIASASFKRSHTNGSDDGTVNSQETHSHRSHRSRDQYDPDLEFLHSSVLEAALQEKEVFEDEHEVLGGVIGDAKDKWDQYWSRTGGMILCGLVLFFWGGVIPYCIVRHEELRGQEVPEVAITPPPTYPPVPPPVSERPSFAPTPTPLPVIIVATPAPSQNATSMPDTIAPTQSILTGAPTVTKATLAPTPLPTNLTTLPPNFSIPNVTTLAPTNITTLPPTISSLTVSAIDNNITIIVNTTAPTMPPTQGATVPPATVSPTSAPIAEYTFNTSTMSPSKDATANSTQTGNGTIITMPPALFATLQPTVSASPSSEPSLAPTAQPEVVFPNYTLGAFNNPGSPQSKAFSWMLRDPNFGTYSPNRMRQRFALAVLYYSTDGDDWNIQTQAADNSQGANQNTTRGRGGLVPWLSYSAHECDWYHKKEDEIEESVGLGFNSIFSLSGVVACENEYHSDGLFRAYKALWLESAGLQGTLPPELALLTGLRELQLSNNELFGVMPPQWFVDDKETRITWQTSLEEMVLKNNSVSGRIPTEIALATSLKRLDLQQNQFQRNIPSEIGLMGNLTHLIWNDNFLSGSIPTEIGKMSALTACAWTNNRLSGTLPTEMASARSLQEFYVGENQLTGTIPWEIMFLMHSLVDLHLHSNQLSQSIPTRLGLLTQLRWLNLANNQFTGTIPTSLGRMTLMQLFQVENNSLQGDLPSEHLASWTLASRVWLHNNAQLFGTIPMAWCPGGAIVNPATELVNETAPTGLINNDTFTDAAVVVASTVEFPTQQTVDVGQRSVDIRVDCGSVTCPCVVGCSCHAMELRHGGRKRGLRRG